MPESADITTVLKFEGHEIAFLETATGELMARAADLAPAMGINLRSVLKRVQDLDESERGALQVHPLSGGGPQKAIFLTQSGALQVICTGRTEICARLRKEICDFYVEHHRGAYTSRETLRAIIREEIQQMVYEPTRVPRKILIHTALREEGFLTAVEAAVEMGVHRRTVRRGCGCGTISGAKRQSGEWFVPIEEVERYQREPFTLWPAKARTG